MTGVLMLQPVRANTNPAFLQRAEVLAAALTYPLLERVVVEGHYERNGGKYTPHAQARNRAIEVALQPHHDRVLWVDIDLVDYPPDLVERLLADDLTISAALPFVEMLDPHAGRVRENGGWFYDIGGFVRNGEWVQMWSLPENMPGTYDSVGTCYMAPAWLYREGCRYDPEGDEVEHLSFCRQARARGVTIVATDTIVQHAYLPKYGEGWH